MRTTLWMLITMGIYCILPVAAQAEGDPAAGRYKFSTCEGCHAIPGYTNVYPTYHVPKLGGQHAEYIISALKAYKTGNRKHETMHANAATLSEQDMADIAAFVSDMPSSTTSRQPAIGNPSAGKEKSVTCQTCHGADGNGSDPQFPRLAGQYVDYMVNALEGYQTGKRNNPIMQGIVKDLSPQDYVDISAYFASQEKGLTVVK